VLAAVLVRLTRREWVPLALVVTLALALRAALPQEAMRYDRGGRLPVRASDIRRLDSANATITRSTKLFALTTCERMLAGVLQSSAEWTLAHSGQPIPYFSLGPSSNFAGKDEAPPVWWSFVRGFGAAEGNEGSRVLGRRGRYHRERVRTLLHKAGWLNAPLRAALARHLGVQATQIVFGGEGDAVGHLWHPAVQVYLPSLAWAFVINPHEDKHVFEGLLEKAGGDECDSSTRQAFLLPLATPPGAGLYFWNLRRPDGTPSDEPVQHAQSYEVGTLYSWPLGLTHALQPWPYLEWDAAALRVTLQLFGVRCADTWYFYH